jgi:hypothetical protein
MCSRCPPKLLRRISDYDPKKWETNIYPCYCDCESKTSYKTLDGKLYCSTCKHTLLDDNQ